MTQVVVNKELMATINRSKRDRRDFPGTENTQVIIRNGSIVVYFRGELLITILDGAEIVVEDRRQYYDD